MPMPANPRTPIFFPKALMETGGGIKFENFGAPNSNDFGASWPNRVSFNERGQHVETQTLRVRMANVKAFGVQANNMAPEKYGMGFVIDESSGVVQLLESLVAQKRAAVKKNFAQMLPNRAATALSSLNDSYRKQLGKAKKADKPKLVGELVGQLSAAERTEFDAQAAAAAEDLVRLVKQSDGRGGLLSQSTKNDGEYILNAEVYVEKPRGGAPKGAPAVQFYDEAQSNPKLQLVVQENGIKLDGSAVFGSVGKPTAPVFTCQAAVLELKKTFIKSDNAMVSDGFSVVHIDKSVEGEEEEFNYVNPDDPPSRPSGSNGYHPYARPGETGARGGGESDDAE